MSASASASGHPSTVPETPDLDDLGEEFLYDKDILNNPLWYNTAVQLGVDPALTHRKKDTSLQQYFTVPPLFLSDSGHSGRIWWNGTGICWIPLDSTGIRP